MKTRHFLSGLVIIPFFLGLQLSGQVFDEKFEHWPLDLSINGTVVVLNQIQDPQVLPGLNRRYAAPSKDDTPPTEKTAPGLVKAVVLSWEPFSKKRQKNWLKQRGLAEDSHFFQLEKADWTKIDPAIQSNSLVILSLWDQKLPAELPPLGFLLTRLERHLQNRGIIVTTGNNGKLLSTKVLSGTGVHGQISEGLGLVPDSVIETRFDKKNDERRLRNALAAYPALVGIGVQSNTCLVLRGRKLFAFKSGQAQVMLAANERQGQRNHRFGIGVDPGNRFNLERNLVDLTEWRRDAMDRTLPPFPPANPREPYVKNGSLVIVGGGGMPRGLMEKMISLAGGQGQARMVYVPCSEDKLITGVPRTVELWKKMGVRHATFIHTKDRVKANRDQAFLEPLKNATGIWFGGGRQWNFSDSYYGTQAHRLMKEVLKRGGVIGGSSAGASIQARYLARATPIGNFKIMAPGYERGGLGFISGVAIDQHFSQRNRQKDMTQLMLHHPQLLGIGLDEATAIIVQKQNAKVVGQGKAHFYDRTQPVVLGQPDFIALPAGSAYDLRSRKILIDTRSKTGQDGGTKSKQDIPD